MQTYRLWLESDSDIPELKKIGFALTEVDIKDVLENGVHPWSERNANRRLAETFNRHLNDDRHNIPGLKELQYCEELKVYGRDYYHDGNSQFESHLEWLNQQVRFIENFTFPQLLELAKRELKKRWDHATAKKLLHQVHYGFNEARSFIKAKDKSVKLASYDDLDRYDLSTVLSLDDFEGEDKILVSHGLPVTNFRHAGALKAVTDGQGRLRLSDSIDNFELISGHPREGYEERGRYYYEGNCIRYLAIRKPGQIILMPDLRHDSAHRAKAQELATRWRTDTGQYCFTTDIDHLREMLVTGQFQISFNGVTQERYAVSEAHAQIGRRVIERFGAGSYVSFRASGDTIKNLLRHHNVSMTGTKEELIGKLAELAAKLYRRHESELRSYFKENRFIRTEATGGGHQFPVLQAVDLKAMITTMFVIRHLRGNSIVDVTQENDTYDLRSLARSLVNEDIKLSGSFLRIEN
ncbi:MAG: hypothetical protein WAU88_08280 [Candidatus Zixiibacteriota bacterium]